MSAAANAPLRVVICGGGRTGTAAAVLFKQRPGVHVTVHTAHAAWRDAHRKGQSIHVDMPDGGRLSGRPDAVTHDVEQAVAEADIVIITVPAHVRASLLARLAPGLPLHKKVFVGAIPGHCGFDWLAEHALQARSNAVIWGMKDVSHTACDLRPGVSVRIGGAKQALHVATHVRECDADRSALLAHLQRLYLAPVSLLKHYLEITLTPGNPIMHGAALYGLIGPQGQWHGRAFPGPMNWWDDCSELGARFMAHCDQETQAMRQCLQCRLGQDLSSVASLQQEIVEAYGSQIEDTSSLWHVLRSNRAYRGIAMPLRPAPSGSGFVVDTTHRSLREDVVHGLALLVEIGLRLGVPTPTISEIFHWLMAFMGTPATDAPRLVPAGWASARRLP